MKHLSLPLWALYASIPNPVKLLVKGRFAASLFDLLISEIPGGTHREPATIKVNYAVDNNTSIVAFKVIITACIEYIIYRSLKQQSIAKKPASQSGINTVITIHIY